MKSSGHVGNHPIVYVIAAIIFGIGCAMAYWAWPAGITNLTMAQITFGSLLWAAASGAIFLIASAVALLFCM